MANRCESCAYFYAKTTSKEIDSCYVEPGKRYVVWGERPACACFKSKVEAEREEERQKLKEQLEG